LKRVLVIRCGALGDLVYATSVIDALQMEFGEETLIDFVCTLGSKTLFANDSRVNHVFSLKHKKIPLLLSSDKKAIVKASQQNSYDILINFEFGKQFRTLVEKINANKKIGALCEDVNIPNDVVHMVDISKYLFKSLVCEDVYKKSFPRVVGSSKEEVYEKYALDQKYIIISPSNSHQKSNRMNYRAWQDESWIELINKLSQEIQVVIVGNKNEDEFFNKLKPYPPNVLDLVAKTPLSDLIGVIENASALVATDTGTAHLASALNTEVFALIGPTPAEVTGPYQSPYNKVHIISSNQECAPCYKTEVMWNCKDNVCMKKISVEMVYNSIKSAKL
jgi:ADP-heptose:LPS heptosyltransferase